MRKSGRGRVRLPVSLAEHIALPSAARKAELAPPLTERAAKTKRPGVGPGRRNCQNGAL